MREYERDLTLKLIILLIGYAMFGFVLPFFVIKMGIAAFVTDGSFDFGVYLAFDTARKIAIPIFLVLLILFVIFSIKQFISILKELGNRMKK